MSNPAVVIAFRQPLGAVPSPDNVASAHFQRGGVYNDLVVRCVGKRVTVQVNGETVRDEDVPQLPAEGSLGFHLSGPREPVAILRDVRIREIPSPAK